MTAAVGIKRLGFAVAALAAAGIGALLILPFLMPADAVREAVKAEIRSVTGLDPVLRGSASVSLFPTGTVTFDDVSLGETRLPGLVRERVLRAVNGSLDFSRYGLALTVDGVELRPGGMTIRGTIK